jgi:SH3-like domain-containing protein
MNTRTLRETHQASYADPITLSKGEPLALTGREDVWDGHRWLWAVAQDGREGWVPDGLITDGPAGPVAAGDFSALELSCSAGAAVEIIWQTHGWAWCQKTDGSEGWLPLRILSEG